MSLAAELETLAKAATPGPWHVGEGVNCDNVIAEDGYGVCEAFPRGGPEEDELVANAGFIAFCGTNRDRLIAGLQQLERSEAQLERVMVGANGIEHRWSPDCRGSGCWEKRDGE